MTEPDSAGEGRLVLFTSGTSGRPKPAVHTWRSLAAAVRQEDRFADRCWMLTYEPSKFAALQVILQALLTGGRLAVPEELTPQAAACCLVEQQVEFASGTPTFWRMLLQTGRRWPASRSPCWSLSRCQKCRAEPAGQTRGRSQADVRETRAAVPILDVPAPDLVPLEWGTLVAVTPAFPPSSRLWFQDESGTIRFVNYDHETNQLAAQGRLLRRR